MELVGEASMSWNPRPEGEFDSGMAVTIGEKILSLIEEEKEAIRMSNGIENSKLY